MVYHSRYHYYIAIEIDYIAGIIRINALADEIILIQFSQYIFFYMYITRLTPQDY